MNIYYSNADITRLILCNPNALSTFMSCFDDEVQWKRGEEDISRQITEPQVLMALCMTLSAVDERLLVEDGAVKEDLTFSFEDQQWTLQKVWAAAGGYVDNNASTVATEASTDAPSTASAAAPSMPSITAAEAASKPSLQNDRPEAAVGNNHHFSINSKLIASLLEEEYRIIRNHLTHDRRFYMDMSEINHIDDLHDFADSLIYNRRIIKEHLYRAEGILTAVYPVEFGQKEPGWLNVGLLESWIEQVHTDPDLKQYRTTV